MRTLLLITLFTLSHITIAQIHVKGTVSDKEGLALPGVNVIELGTTTGDSYGYRWKL